MLAAQSFLRTILERPDDDTARLVYADWLEEQGEPLAEMIRIQCELAHLGGGAERRRAQLLDRERELRVLHEAEWFGAMQALGVSGRFLRGLVEVHVSGIHLYLDMAERLLCLPHVLHVRLTDAAATRDEVRALAASAAFMHVRRLDLSRSRLGNDGILHLAKAERPGRLSHLDFSSNLISSTGLRYLVESVDLSDLVELRFSGNGIGEGGALALARCPRLSRLRILDLSYNQLGTVGGEYLSEAVSLNHLQCLLVRGNSIGPKGKKALRRRFGPRVHLGSLDSPY